MQRGFDHNQRRQRAIRRLVSLFLLCFCAFDLTVVDLLLPQLCENEGVTRVGASASSDQIVQIDHLIAHRPDRNEQLPPEPSTDDGDCFCCCAHVLPTIAYQAQPVFIHSHMEPVGDESLPTAPPLELFRPPRIA